MTVNGATASDIPTGTNERLRLRLINAGARLFALRIEQHEPRVMAIDGQPAQPFLPRNGQIALAPGNRIDLFVDAGLPPGSVARIFVANEGDEAVLARLVYGPAPARAEPLPRPDSLPGNPLPEKIDLASSLKVEAVIEPGSRSFSGMPFAESGPEMPPLFTVKRGRSVTVGFVNRSPAPLVLHVHGHAMRLLDRLDDGWKPFWLDTLPVDAGATIRTAFVADNPGKWLVESGVLGDRGPGRAAWFEVT
jgi:FtsP/CotA-like multicopper oxidase with cupredoxin domain